MRGGDVFDFYRQVLALVVGTYVLLRTANFVLRWQAATASAVRTEAMVRRYLAVHLLRAKIHRFAFDLLQLAALLAVLGYLLWLHWQRAFVGG